MELTINKDTKTISDGETSDRLSEIEFNILKYLIENKGKIISRNTLADIVGTNESSLKTHIWNLRTKKRVKIQIVVIPKMGVMLMDNTETETETEQ